VIDPGQPGVKKLNADLVVVSGRRAALPFRESFARHRLTQIAGLPGVRSVHPLYMEYYLSLVRNPAEPFSPRHRQFGWQQEPQPSS
jgi:putative ABC transport system permease protein